MKRAFLVQPITPSRALDRVRKALCADPRCGDDFPEEDADVVILQVVGRRDQIASKVSQILRRGQKYALIQFVLRTSQKPKVADWLVLWESAQVVWSYLPLEAWAAEEDMGYPFHFYHAPLGVDGEVFRPWFTKHFDGNNWMPDTVMTTGRGWLTESAREVTLAARKICMTPWHLGRTIRHGVESTGDISDEDLADLYCRCDYVSGLRRTEGFELPAAEGLLCGARPILFNNSCYKSWYQNWAEYIEESDRQGVVDQLVDLFRRPVRPVTQAERDAAAKVFHWPTVVDGFLTRCLA